MGIFEEEVAWEGKWNCFARSRAPSRHFWWRFSEDSLYLTYSTLNLRKFSKKDSWSLQDTRSLDDMTPPLISSRQRCAFDSSDLQGLEDICCYPNDHCKNISSAIGCIIFCGPFVNKNICAQHFCLAVNFHFFASLKSQQKLHSGIQNLFLPPRADICIFFFLYLLVEPLIKITTTVELFWMLKWNVNNVVGTWCNVFFPRWKFHYSSSHNFAPRCVNRDEASALIDFNSYLSYLSKCFHVFPVISSTIARGKTLQTTFDAICFHQVNSLELTDQ